MRTKRGSVLWATALTLAFVTTSSVWAHDSGEKVTTGTVTAVNPTASTFTIETSSGSMSYIANRDTRFSSSGRRIDLENLALGDRVSIRSDKLMENAVVSRVEVLSSGNLTAENRKPRVLPRTASPLPLLGLLGSMLLVGALLSRAGLRWLR